MLDWHIKAREMRESGAKIKDIAAALGKDLSGVAKIVRTVKCPINHYYRYVRKTPHWHIEACEMRAAGAKLKDIAAALGKDWTAVASAVETVKCPIDHRRGTRIWIEERKREFETMWLAGVPTKEIGRRFNLVNPRNYARELGLPRRRETWISWTPKLDNELRRLWRKLRYRRGTNKSFLIRDIAKHFGTTESAIGMRAMSLGLRQKWGRKEWTEEDDRIIREQWPDYDISVQQIALRVGHSRSSLSNRRRRLGLPPRPLNFEHRISLHAWQGMTSEERARVPDWRMPVMHRRLVRRSRKPQPSPTRASAGQPV